MNKLNIIKTKAIKLWLVARTENFRIQDLRGLGFHRNDKQKILCNFFSIMFNRIKVAYPTLDTIFLSEYSEVSNLD